MKYQNALVGIFAVIIVITALVQILHLPGTETAKSIGKFAFYRSIWNTSITKFSAAEKN